LVGEEEALVHRMVRQNIPLYKPAAGTLLQGVTKEITRWDELAEDMKRSEMNGLEQLPGLSIYVKPYELDDFVSTYQVDQKSLEKEDRITLKDFKNERTLDDAFAVYPYKVMYVTERNQIVPLRKVKEPVQTDVDPLPLDAPERPVKDDHLYVPNLIVETVSVKFEHCGRDMEKYFLLYARDQLEGRCIKEGYVRPETTKVITYTSGGIHGTLIEFRVLYMVQVCHPYEGMRLSCTVESVSKIGIRAVVRKSMNPIVVYLTRELNPLIYMEDYELEQVIEVSVLGHRFEMKDPFISVLGVLAA
jgi:DNA-directed RNA polymerase subunit E'/Rpb7